MGALLGFLALRAARADAESARRLLERVVREPEAFRTPEGRAIALTDVDAGTARLSRARGHITGSLVLSAAGHLPMLEAQRAGVLQLIDDAHTATTTLRGALVEVGTLSTGTPLSEGRVPYSALGHLETTLRGASQTVASLNRPATGLVGPVRSARRRLDRLVGDGATRLDLAVDGIGAARSFTGEAGTRRYLVAFQNNAEMRDQGMVLSYAVARFSDGRLAFDHHGSVEELALDRPVPIQLPPGTQEVFGPISPAQTWQSVNASADFALSGQLMADMYRQATGQAVDGVVAVDVPGLAAILRVVGPVLVPGEAEPVTAERLGPLLLHDLYDGIPAAGDRRRLRQREANITATVIERLTTADYGVVSLGEELGRATGGGHLRLWSGAPAEERVFERLGIGGGPATAMADRTFHLAVENRSATKVDYYVKPTVRQDVHVTRSGTALVRTTVELDNQAPVGAPPSYQLGPDPAIRAPGDYLAWLLLWGPAGSTQPGGVDESGLVLAQHVVSVAAGGHTTLTFPETVIPRAVRDGRLDLRLVPQPRLEDAPLEVELTADGWHVDGPRSWRGLWDRVVHVGWRVHR